MISIFVFLSCILVLLSILPFSKNQHWLFQVPDFIRPQVFVLQLLVLVCGIVNFKALGDWIWLLVLLIWCVVYNLYVFARFTKFWRNNKFTASDKHSNDIKIIALNVYQFNTEYSRLLDLIDREQPDAFLTMESNKDWENAMRPLEQDYPSFQKITLENTYGMHFYTKLKINAVKVHYFVADDLPSIEAELETSDGYRFVFFGVHPPPPSPTEEETSKERDGDLLSVAKMVKDYKLPVFITGDFNTVAWSRASILFKKTSGLIDARYGRGYLATFHTKYWFFRIPLDLLYHSSTIFIRNLKILPSIGSDHFPIMSVFYIDKHNDEQESDIKTLDAEEKKEVEELIVEGKEEQSDNRENV